MADLTIPAELRTIVTQLRCDCSFPVIPPHSLAAPGPCKQCGVAWTVCARDIPDRLREPLAALLEKSAEQFEEFPGTYLSCERCDHVFGEDTPGEDNCTCYSNALAVARAVNGGATA